MRLDKYLSKTLGISRNEAKTNLRKKLIQVNGITITDGGFEIQEEKDTITCDNQKTTYQKYRYYMLNKPVGVITSTMDPREQTVLSCLPVSLQKDIFPVGRLDKDATGLLLLTNDGELSHELLSPKKKVKKIYEITFEGEYQENIPTLFEQGLQDKEDSFLPAKFTLIQDHLARVEVQEGKFHEVKRLAKCVGLTVITLKRIQMGSLILDKSLKEGQYRELTKEEIKCFEKGKKD
jgi:16S rRNA pseudouridine516 synthase